MMNLGCNEAHLLAVATYLRGCARVLTVLFHKVEGMVDDVGVMGVYVSDNRGVADGYLVVWPDRTARYVPHPGNHVPVALMGSLASAMMLEWRSDEAGEVRRVEEFLDAFSCWDCVWRWEASGREFKVDARLRPCMSVGSPPRTGVDAMVSLMSVRIDGAASLEFELFRTGPMPLAQAAGLTRAVNTRVSEVVSTQRRFGWAA